MYFSLYVILIIFIQTSATKNSNKKFILYGFRRQFFLKKMNIITIKSNISVYIHLIINYKLAITK